MLADPERLKWWGIDMRPRWRRRVAVIATYLVIFATGLVIVEYLENRAYLALAAWCVATLAIMRVSVLRGDGVVKRFEDRAYVRVGGMGERVLVNGLDQWAQYHYGVADFESASEVQKDELLSRFKMGTRLFPRKPGEAASAPWLDERELKERGSVERWALKAIVTPMACYAGMYVSRAARHETVKALDVAFDFWLFAALVMTLPKARVLWTEPDPRELEGEIQLVGAPPVV